MNIMDMQTQKSILNWINPNLKIDGKTLAYFASGTLIKDEPFDNLEFGNIFFVDCAFKENSFNRKNIFRLKLDSIDAVYLFKLLNISIDYFVALNEGLYEGGGKYPLNTDGFLGYCYPIFSDKIVHIGCPDYYDEYRFHHLRNHYLDLPYKSKFVIDSKVIDFISPNIFSDINNPQVTLLKGKISTTFRFDIGDLKAFVKHCSIWTDLNELDAIFVKYDNEYQKKKIESLEKKAFPLMDYPHKLSAISNEVFIKYDGGYDIDGIVELIIKNKFEKIGIVPNLWNYTELFDKLSKAKQLKELTFYHLNKDDFSELYNKTW